jgi:pSer/pThr/pTyr-binding forkhead associated (FHA) protein
MAPAAPVARAASGTVDLSRTFPAPPPEHDSPHDHSSIATSPVVALGESSTSQRICPRCRAASDGGAQFCRVCGASLAEAQQLPMQPAPPPYMPLPRFESSPPAAHPSRPPLVSPLVQAAASAFAEAGRVPRVGARLVLVARDGGEGPKYPLGDITDIGRDEGSILVADDLYLSPRHARVSFRTGAYFLRDLGSTNGVFVRVPFVRPSSLGARKKPVLGASPAEQELEDQDLFLVGQQVLRFEVVKDADEGFGVASDNGTLLFGTPATPRFARLSQRTVEGVTRDIFHVRRAETVIGREGSDIVFTDDPFLSRRHAVLRIHGGGAEGPRRFTLADLGSSNGTFLQVHEEIELRQGDHFRIGQQLFRFDLEEARNGA